MYRMLKNYTILFSILIGFFATFLLYQVKIEVPTSLQEGIAKEVIRFHVLANSDSYEDQELKMQVKEGIIAYLKEEMGEKESVEQSREWMKEHLEEIQKLAQKLVWEGGCQYPVKVEFTKDFFPVKAYGDCTFPSGIYQALRIQIGKAAGKNWWCVLFPSLCFTDSIQGVVEEDKKQELRSLLTEEEYDCIINPAKVKIRFKILGQ